MASPASTTWPAWVPPRAIGLDGTSFLTATAQHPTLLVTGIMDLDTGRLVDVLPARSATAVAGWLASKPARWLTGIDHVVIDPYQPYATAVAAELADARRVVDHFHVVRLANATLDEVRRRTQQTSLGHRGRSHDPLYRIRQRLLAGHERLGPTGFARVLSHLDAGVRLRRRWARHGRHRHPLPRRRQDRQRTRRRNPAHDVLSRRDDRHRQRQRHPRQRRLRPRQQRVHWPGPLVQIDIDRAAEDLEHLITPEERLRIAMARQ
jgi:transposase